VWAQAGTADQVVVLEKAQLPVLASAPLGKVTTAAKAKLT
jgi:hypothetical protein